MVAQHMAAQRTVAAVMTKAAALRPAARRQKVEEAQVKAAQQLGTVPRQYSQIPKVHRASLYQSPGKPLRLRTQTVEGRGTR